MILFMILLLMAVLLTLITVVSISVGGTTFIILFGDVIVCIFIIVWIMRRLCKRKK